ncbi:MAG: SurA N-terminal domain-containing protein [Clostridium sp.]|nr:SurA N-terminal domain-containing protein [Clostridium sp.]
MATLEKIRSKSILLIVIIGVALLAFIIGDFFTSGRTIFGTGTTVAKVGGEKIDITDFQRRVEQHNQAQQQSARKTDGAQIQQQAINELVAEKLFQKELDRLGLTVTDAELADVMLGRGSMMLSGRVAQETQGQIQSINELHNMITRPGDYGMTPDQVSSLRAYWQQLESETEQQLLQQKYMTLFTGTLVANELDAKALYDENATPLRMAYTKKDYSSLANEEFEPTEQELNDEWAKNKNAYKIDQQIRTISYISVPVVPSQADILAGQQRVEDALVILRGSDDPASLSSMPDFVVDQQRSTASRIRNNDVKRFVDTASVGAAAMVNRNANSYTLAKLFGRTVETDSVCLDYLVVNGREQMDSIMIALNAGTLTFADAASNPAVAESQDSVWLALTTSQAASLRDIVNSSPNGVYFTPDTASTTPGGRIMRINRRNAPVSVYDYAVVTYSIDPSEATINKLEDDFQRFLTENNTSAKFEENALAAGYQVFPTKVSASSPMVNNIPDSRAAVVWALGADKGQVSPIFGNETTGRLLAVALDDIYNDYIPARDPQVADYLKARVLSHKKGERLMADYNGKASTLAEYAQLLGGSVDTTRISFGQVVVPNIGMGEAELQACAFLAEPGKLQAPVEGSSALIVFEIVSTDPATRPYDFNESAQAFNGSRGSYRLSNMMPQILQGNKKVENNLHKFYTN